MISYFYVMESMASTNSLHSFKKVLLNQEKGLHYDMLIVIVIDWLVG